jgi:hypothetical protein
LASGFVGAEDIAVDATHAYVTDIGDNSVWRIERTGSFTKQQVATGQAKPYRIALDSSYVYWSSQLGGAIVRRRKDLSDSATPVITAQGPMGLVVDDSFVYWFNSGDTTVYRAAKSDLSVHVPLFVVGDTPDEMIGTDNFIYFSSRFRHVGRIDKTTLDVTVGDSAAQGTWYGVAADDTGAYSAWFRAAGDLIQPPTGDTIFLAGAARPRALRSDGCNLFYTTGSSLLYWVPRGFTSPIPLANGAAVQSNRLVIDGGFVYFTDVAFVGRVPL